MSNPFHLAIFASGAGTNADKIMEYFQFHEKVRVVALFCNRKEAGAMKVAEKWGIPAILITREMMEQPDLWLSLLLSFKVDGVVLAGFLRKIPSELIRAYEGKIINIHPALLPRHGGKGMYGRFVHEAVKNSGDKETGISIHHVSREYDEGGLIEQYSVIIDPSDSVEDIERKVHELEHRHFPEAIERFILSL